MSKLKHKLSLQFVGGTDYLVVKLNDMARVVVVFIPWQRRAIL